MLSVFFSLLKENAVLAVISLISTVLLINAVEKYDRLLAALMGGGNEPGFIILLLIFMGVYKVLFFLIKEVALFGKDILLELLPKRLQKRNNRKQIK